LEIVKGNSVRESCLQFGVGLWWIKAHLASICSILDDADRRVIASAVMDI